LRFPTIENVKGEVVVGGGRRTLSRVGSERAMLRAGGPFEGDYSKETNIAVAS